MKIIGHRGARGLAPENTIAGLRKGLEHHADELEFDLRVTHDGIVILHHNPELIDPDSQKHVIASTDYAVLKHHKPDLVTFEEVLEQIGHLVPLYIEVKPRVNTKPIVKIIKSYLKKGWRPEYFLLGSFSQKTLLELHAALPNIEKIVIEHWSGVRAHYRARQLGTKWLSMDQHWLWWGFIRATSKSGYRLYTFSLNNPGKARRWAKWGLYGAVTDYPDRFEKR